MPNKTAGETECPAAPPEAPPPSRAWALKLLVPILILAAWDLTVRFGDVSPFIIPSPWDILREFYDNMLNGRLPLQIFISLKRSLGGFLLGSALGIFLGVIMGWSRVWNLLFDLAVNFIRSVPKTALAPLFLIWFGLGDLSKVLLIAFSSFFFTVIPTIEGVKNVDHTYIKSARSMGADNLQVLLTVVLPAALPSIFAGGAPGRDHLPAGPGHGGNHRRSRRAGFFARGIPNQSGHGLDVRHPVGPGPARVRTGRGHAEAGPGVDALAQGENYIPLISYC